VRPAWLTLILLACITLGESWKQEVVAVAPRKGLRVAGGVMGVVVVLRRLILAVRAGEKWVAQSSCCFASWDCFAAAFWYWSAYRGVQSKTRRNTRSIRKNKCTWCRTKMDRQKGIPFSRNSIKNRQKTSLILTRQMTLSRSRTPKLKRPCVKPIPKHYPDNNWGYTHRWLQKCWLSTTLLSLIRLRQ